MRISTSQKRRCGFLIAILLFAIPLVGVGQGLAREAFSQPPAQAALELSPPPAEFLPPSTSGPLGGETNFEVGVTQDTIETELIRADLTGAEPAVSRAAAPFGYNLRQSNTSWLVGGGDDFGIFSLEAFPSLSPGEKSSLVAGLGFHFLAGPIRTDMPPRLLDFQIGFQRRKWVSDTSGYDLSARVGAFSDFEGSARKGVRFPGHAVGYYRWSSRLDLVLGIEVLDRDDISLLPVAGVIFTLREDLRLELLFPRPRVEVRISPTHALYLAGELGGGTWAIERVTLIDDVVTYRDLRLLLGISSRDDKGQQAAFEIGYVFNRDLSYRSGLGDFVPDDTLLLQLTHRY